MRRAPLCPTRASSPPSPPWTCGNSDRSGPPRSRGSIEMTASHPDGSFELFCYPVRTDALVATRKGTISFSHPDYVDTQIEDAYALPPEGRTGLLVVLPTGHKLAGTVLDAAG